MHREVHGEHPDCKSAANLSEGFEANAIIDEPRGAENDRPYDGDADDIVIQRWLHERMLAPIGVPVSIVTQIPPLIGFCTSFV